MNSGPWLQSWLQRVAQRLAAKGYSRFDPNVYEPLGVTYAARRTRSGPLSLGTIDDFFIIAETEELDTAKLNNFSKYSFDFADANTSSLQKPPE